MSTKLMMFPMKWLFQVKYLTNVIKMLEKISQEMVLFATLLFDFYGKKNNYYKVLVSV